jgi:zinc protease
MDEITRVLNEGVSKEEVDGAIERMRNNAVFAKDDFGTAAQVFGVALTSGGTIESVEGWLDRISEVTPETALLAAKAVLEGKHHVTAELLAKPQS